MRYKRLKLGAVLLLAFGLTEMQAQQSINTSGGNATGSSGTVSYSVGQVAYMTHAGTTGSVAQGVQHAFEIFNLDLEEVESSNVSVLVYPNPTAEFLTLEVKDLDHSTLGYQLYDLQGRLLKSEPMTDQKTKVDMRTLPSATYFIKMSQGKTTIQSFKIIKK